MNKFAKSKVAWTVAGVMVLASVATPQLRQILKAGGVVAVISAFGKDINNGMNKLWGRDANSKVKTKIVPILTMGSGTAVGAVQIMGPAASVDRVVAVAQPEVKLLGNEVRIRALIPISDKNLKGKKDGSGLNVVEEVGVSGIVDLKL